MSDDRLPPGFRRVGPNEYEGPLAKIGPGVYRGKVRVITGKPDPSDGTHDCDAMGCRQEHVVFRETLDRRCVWSEP